MSMKDKSRQETSRRDFRDAHGYDARMTRHKSKLVVSQDDRDGNGPLPRHRSMAVRPHERDRDRDAISHYQGRSSHATTPMSPEEVRTAISTLLKQVKETTVFFADFKEEYQRDVRHIMTYAGQDTLEVLWVRKIMYSGKGRSGKARSKHESVDQPPTFKQVSRRLWKSLENAYMGAMSDPSGQNDSLARKLAGARSEVGPLLDSVESYSQAMDSVIKELKLLKVVLELGGAGKTSNDDKANQRHSAHAMNEGPREGSDSDDDNERNEKQGEHLERSNGREEDEAGDDEEGQDLDPTHRAV